MNEGDCDYKISVVRLMFQMGRTLVLNLVLLQYYVYGSNILVWNPSIAHSHVKFLGNIADVLTMDGHNVVRCTLKLKPVSSGIFLNCKAMAYEKGC